MANYRDIKGFQIQSTDTDPEVYAGSWASGGSLNQSRYSLGGAGTQAAGLVFGGYSAPSRRNETEEYNGTAWTTVVGTLPNQGNSGGPLFNLKGEFTKKKKDYKVMDTLFEL